MAFDTSAAHCAAALLLGGKIVAERYEEMKKGQAERLFPMLEEVLDEVGAVWHELDAIGVGVGPGNFTGIRIAVSAARGLAMSLNVPAVGVTSFEVVRGNLTGSGLDEVVSLPAPRNSVYLQRFQDGTASEPVLVELHQAAFSTLDPKTPGTRVIGHEADFVAMSLTRPDPNTPDDPYRGGYGEETVPENPAGMVALLAARRLDSPTEIRPPSPLYVRPPDAAPSSDPPPVILP